MWALALVMAVVAGCCHACPESCECHRLPDVAEAEEAACLGGAPRLPELSSRTRRLRVLNAEETDVLELLEDLANGVASLPYLQDFEFGNCSIGTLNASSWSTGLERARTLNLSRNHLTDLKDAAWLNGGANVSAAALTTLDVSRNALAELGADTFGTLSVLVRLCLRGNEVARVHARAFVGLGALEELDLSDNRLVSLPDDALTPLASLQKLDLSGNQLRTLGAGWFETLGRLRELDVSRNGLARAASGALQPLPGLSVLRLAGNPLRERDVSLLLGTGRKLETVDASRTGLIRVPAALTRSVRALRLAGNRLTSIRGGDLDSYPLLRLLDMSDNRLINVEEDALGRLEVLEHLDVSGNSLTEVPRSLPASLTSLNLDGNLVKLLRFNDLQGLYNLRALSLRGNAILEIQEGALGQLQALRVLDVSDNPVEELPANTLNGPTRLDTLRMSGLTALRWNERNQGDMTFPVPAPERLLDLDVSGSPVLAAQLLADTAALSAFKSLLRLNLERTNLTTLGSDFIDFVPQLRVLGLGGNSWTCSENLYWLGEWTRKHEELEPAARCASDGGIRLRDLPSPPSPPATSTAAYPAQENWTSSETSRAIADDDTDVRTQTSNFTTALYPDYEDKGEHEAAIGGADGDEDYLATEELRWGLEPENVTLELEEPAGTTATTGEQQQGPLSGITQRDVPPNSSATPSAVGQKMTRTNAGARVSEALSAGAHPGMLVLAGAALGAVAALSVVLSRRASVRRRDNNCCYRRQENIEVHTLTPVTELW